MQTTASPFKQLQGTRRQRVPSRYGMLRHGSHGHDMKHAVSRMCWDQPVNTDDKLSAAPDFPLQSARRPIDSIVRIH